MKYFLFLTIFAAAATAAFIPADEHVNGENGWYVPQYNGSYVWIDMNEYESYLEAMIRMEEPLFFNPVNFYLYTKSNPDTAQEITATTNSIDASNFDAQNPTRIAIHGWFDGKDSHINTVVREAWLFHGNYNIIAVAWGRAYSIEYASSVLAVPGVGKKVAHLVNFLVENYGMKLESLEIIGHSLGAHIAGFAGKNIECGQVHAIIGLDTALPLYNYDKPDSRLSSTDAFYVESIHTNGGNLGFLKPIGKSAFYPNGGKSQPGCGVDVGGSCSHNRVIDYYSEAVKINNFGSIKCSNYEDAVAKNCGSTFSSVHMGAVENAYIVAGDFYVPVNSASPFGVLD